MPLSVPDSSRAGMLQNHLITSHISRLSWLISFRDKVVTNSSAMPPLHTREAPPGHTDISTKAAPEGGHIQGQRPPFLQSLPPPGPFSTCPPLNPVIPISLPLPPLPSPALFHQQLLLHIILFSSSLPLFPPCHGDPSLVLSALLWD